MAGLGQQQRPLSDRLENVLQGFIPGLATMENPPRPAAVGGRGQEAIIIEMPTAPTTEGPGDAGGARGGAGGGPGGGADQRGEAEGVDRPSGGIGEGLRAVRPWIERTLPFVVVLLLKILYDHRLGMLVLVGMAAGFFHFNSKIKEQIAERDKRSLQSLLFILLLLPINVALVYFVFADQQLLKCLIFMKPNFAAFDFWTLLWVIGITDFNIRYITMATKCLVAALPRMCLSFKRRGRVFLCVESLSQLYRFVTPIPVWVAFLMEDTETHWLFSYLLVLLYLLAKAYFTYSMFFKSLASLQSIMKDTQYGNRPSSDHMQEVGDACPICQDNFANPVQLHCMHIFCEECVTTWFDRERTCPMCRAKVADSPLWRDGGTTAVIQWY